MGVIDAGIFHRLLNEENTFFDEAWHEAVLSNLALKRFGHAEEVSERALEISDKTDKKLFRIVSFVISSIITRITKNIKKT